MIRLQYDKLNDDNLPLRIYALVFADWAISFCYQLENL